MPVFPYPAWRNLRQLVGLTARQIRQLKLMGAIPYGRLHSLNPLPGVIATAGVRVEHCTFQRAAAGTAQLGGTVQEHHTP